MIIFSKYRFTVCDYVLYDNCEELFNKLKNLFDLEMDLCSITSFEHVNMGK